ncbi:MAG: phosphate acyltransferase PlsX, partial [Oscillospiraceae bacterium]
KRPAIGTMIPTGKGEYYLLVDAGANHDCRPEMLKQFAIMGTAYWQGVYGKEKPRVGLVNIGTEANKGDDLRKSTFVLLHEEKSINFIGNIEARDLPLAGCDVAVCDGFTGNVILKLSEGFGKFFSNSLKDMLLENLLTKMCALVLNSRIVTLKKMMDYKEQGGAPLLGIRQPVIKAHGASDSRAFKNAIRQAVFCVKGDVCSRIEQITLEELVKEQEEKAREAAIIASRESQGAATSENANPNNPEEKKE